MQIKITELAKTPDDKSPADQVTGKKYSTQKLNIFTFFIALSFFLM